jgi:hypothetical protein
MKYILLAFLVFSLSKTLPAQKSIYGYLDAKPIYLYTNSEFWDVFEVSELGSSSVRTINDNAKLKLLTELIINGNSLKKIIKPLVPNSSYEKLSLENNANILNNIVNDTSCMKGLAKSLKNPIILSRRKQQKKEFIIQVNLNNIRKQLKNLE